MSGVQFDKRVEASIDKLRAMGLSVYIDAESKDSAYIVVNMESVIRMIDKRITYPSRKTEMEGSYMIIHVWKNQQSNTNPAELAPQVIADTQESVTKNE